MAVCFSEEEDYRWLSNIEKIENMLLCVVRISSQYFYLCCSLYFHNGGGIICNIICILKRLSNMI